MSEDSGKTTETQAEGRKAKKILEVKHEYTSEYLDKNISDIDSYEVIRAGEVADALEYFDQVKRPLSYQLHEAIQIMERRKEDPYGNLRLPEHIGTVSVSDLMNLLSNVSNAYMTYAEYMSASRAILTMRENLYERRKNRAAINEGTNDTERKALASMRSDPELMMVTKVQICTNGLKPGTLH
jgi:hypothetical protein